MSNKTLIAVDRVRPGVVKLTLNNPPLNLNSIAMTGQLERALADIENDSSVRVVVITGTGEKAFCAGSDVHEFPEILDQFVERKLRKENVVFDAVENLSKPVIAAIEGIALGGGCELAMACDIRVMSETARIGLPEVNLGVFGGSGGVIRTPKLIGMSRTMELMFLGESITAAEAERIGLVTHVVPAGQSVEFALALADKIAGKPFEAIKAIKKGVRECYGMNHQEALALNFKLTELVFHSPDCKEAVSAFLEKRPPKFTSV